MLKIIIPLAGSSELFSKAGFSYPKPLIEINGQTMIEMVINKTKNIKQNHKIIFIVKEEDVAKYHLNNTLKLLAPNSEIVKLKNDTKGALCSILMSIDTFNDNDSILILNGDQIIDTDLDQIDAYWNQNQVDVGVVTFKSVHPRWSYAKIEANQVVQTAEKNPISNFAIAGYYYFKNSKLFFDAAFSCLLKDIQHEGNFFISPVINEFILNNKKVLNFNIDNNHYHSFYSPQMIAEYLKLKS